MLKEVHAKSRQGPGGLGLAGHMGSLGDNNNSRADSRSDRHLADCSGCGMAYCQTCVRDFLLLR